MLLKAQKIAILTLPDQPSQKTLTLTFFLLFLSSSLFLAARKKFFIYRKMFLLLEPFAEPTDHPTGSIAIRQREKKHKGKVENSTLFKV